MQVDVNDGAFLVEASLLSGLFDVEPSLVPALMRSSEITCRCERGLDEHQGEYRLTFFYKGRRARMRVDDSGHVLHRSVVDFGERALPRLLHKPEGL